MNSLPAPPATSTDIRHAADLLVEPGSVVELRILGSTRGTVSGYYDDLDALARDAEAWSGRAEGIYVALNPVNPDLLARAKNRVREFAKATTSDTDILRRRWLLIDFDPVRPSQISATDAEHAAALARARSAAEWLEREMEFPESVLADSGNGAHLLVRVELPNDPASLTLLTRCLAALDLHFSDAAVAVDQKTGNGARISKLYGTLAAKGDATETRPHRLASILSEPFVLDVCSREALERLAAQAPAAATPAVGTGRDGFDLDGFLARHADRLHVVRTGPWQGGMKYILNPCPWNEEHTNSAAYIVRHPSGAISAGCHHNGCREQGWRDLRALLEPDRVVRPSTPSSRPTVADDTPLDVERRDHDDDLDDRPLELPSLAWRGIFAEYREVVQGTSEAPNSAHFAALWAACAAQLRRRVMIHYAYPHFPNVYLVIIGTTGDSKTSAMRQALRLVDDAHVKVLRGSGGSAEAIGDWMQGDDGEARVAHLLYLEEVASLLQRGRWEGSALLPFLTETFDAPDRYETLFRKDPVKVIEPTPTILAGTTPSWFWNSMREVDFHGGFGNRLFFLGGTPKSPIAMPARPDGGKFRAVQDAIKALAEIPECEMLLDRAAHDVWQGFYIAWKTTQAQFDELTAVTTKRAPTYAIKLALVYAALEGTAPTITRPQIEAAISVAHYGVQCAQSLIRSQRQYSIQGRCETAVAKALEGEDLPTWKVHQRIGGRFSAEDVLRAVKALAAAGVIGDSGRKTMRGEVIYQSCHRRRP